MSNDKKQQQPSKPPVSPPPSRDSNVKTDHGSVEFGEGRRQLNEVLNTLPPPPPKKEK